MKPTAIAAIVREFVVQNFYVSDGAALDDGASLLDTGIVDSTGVLEVAAFLEKSFDITIADDEIAPENLDTIARIAEFVLRKQQAAA